MSDRRGQYGFNLAPQIRQLGHVRTRRTSHDCFLSNSFQYRISDRHAFEIIPIPITTFTFNEISKVCRHLRRGTIFRFLSGQ